VSAAAKGLFAGTPWYLDISGGFATPLAAELISRADLVVAWGSTLNMWTTRSGRLIPQGATVAQVDLEASALGVNRKVDIGVRGDVATVARACSRVLPGSVAAGWRSADLRARIAAPDRLTVAALGDGGFAMSVAELVTAVRLRLPLLVVVYDDAAYGAEVHHFGPDGFPLDTVKFPDTDLAAVARGFGCAGAI